MHTTPTMVFAQRRRALATVGGVALLAVCTPWLAHAQAAAAAPAQPVTALQPGAAPLWLSRFQPADASTDRFATPAAAWWRVVFVPALPGRPLELVLRAQRRGHALRVLALDTVPADAPDLALPLPLWGETQAAPQRGEAHPAPLHWRTRFVLPPDSGAPGAFMFVELWRRDGAAPPAIALQLRRLDGMGALHHGTHSGRVEAPPSPLTQAQMAPPPYAYPPPHPHAGPHAVPPGPPPVVLPLAAVEPDVIELPIRAARAPRRPAVMEAPR